MLKRFIAVALVLMCSVTKAETVLESGSLSILKDIQHNIKGLDSEQRVKLITAMFLGTPYNDRTLNSHDSEKESLVVNLKSMDCMTFIEYTEALKQSDNYDDFISNLKRLDTAKKISPISLGDIFLLIGCWPLMKRCLI